MKKGTPTGLCDSYGDVIKVGDRVQRKTDCNREIHGSWVVYEVKIQGIIPILSYLQSEKGMMLPRGYSASLLSDEYDRKILLFINDTKELRPSSDLCILET